MVCDQTKTRQLTSAHEFSPQIHFLINALCEITQENRYRRCILSKPCPNGVCRGVCARLLVIFLLPVSHDHLCSKSFHNNFRFKFSYIKYTSFIICEKYSVLFDENFRFGASFFLYYFSLLYRACSGCRMPIANL